MSWNHRIIRHIESRTHMDDAIYYAKDCKVVALSGTPLINRPNEIAFLLNLLRGPIERIVIVDFWAMRTSIRHWQALFPMRVRPKDGPLNCCIAILHDCR